MDRIIYGPNGLPVQSTQQDDLYLPQNNNWLAWATRYVDGITNPDKVPLEEYQRMDQTDETVFSGSEILIQGVLSRMGDYTHEDQEIHEFVRLNLEQMEGSFVQDCREILSAVKYGFSATEILWRRGPDGRDWLRGLQTLKPNTVSLDIHRAGPEKNKLKSVTQWRYRGHDQVEIPPEKVILLSHGKEFGNLYGCSRYKRAHKSWKIKDVLMLAWAITLERYGSPLTIAKAAGLGSMQRHPVTGQQLSTAEYLTEVMDSLNHKGSMVVPIGTEIEIMKAAQRLGSDFYEIIQYLNRSIHQAIGLPSLIADAGQVGSYSLGKEHTRTFQDILNQILEELTEALLEQLIRPLIVANFGPQENYGQFQVEEFDIELAAKQAEIAERLIRSGIADAESLEDVNHFRTQQGLPLWTEEDLRTAYPDLELDSSENEAPNPDANGVSFAARRRNRIRAKYELYRRISREARRQREAACGVSPRST